jgi:hypothetical protein
VFKLENDIISIYEDIQKGEFKISLLDETNKLDLVKGCLSLDPSLRYSIEQMKVSVYF